MNYLTRITESASRIYSAFEDGIADLFFGELPSAVYVVNRRNYFPPASENDFFGSLNVCLYDGKKHQKKKAVQVKETPTARVEIDKNGNKHVHKKRNGSR